MRDRIIAARAERPFAHPQHRIVLLDGVRGLAALMVCLYHVSWTALPAHGYVAVDLFFMLSGYVIAGAYERKLVQGMTFGAFFRIRMARLYPLYLFGLFVGLAIAVTCGFYPLQSIASFAAGAVFVPLQIPHSSFAVPLDAVMWSLLAEIAVNVFYAAGGFRLNNRALAVVIGASALATFGFMAFTYGLAQGAVSDWRSVIVIGARVLFGFPLGVLLFRLQIQGRLPRAILSTPMLLILMVGAYFVPFNGVLVDSLIQLAAMPALFILLLSAPPVSSRFVKPCLWAGAYSYPLYAVHFPIVQLVQYLKPPLWAYFPAAILAIFLLTAFAHRFIEPLGRGAMANWVAKMSRTGFRSQEA